MKTKLTNKQIDQLLHLNRRLTEIEYGMRQRVESMRPQLDADLSNPDSWLEDYEFDSVIYFGMREDDPQWDDDKDNVIAEWELESFKTVNGDTDRSQEKSDYSNIGDGKNHALPGIVDDRLLIVPHCWLFHVLYDDIPVSWKNMLRIGAVWIDLQVRHQREERII
jgi:hypothetical protein